MKASPSGRLLYRVINNTGAYMTGDVFYRLVNFFSGVLVVRSLGREAFGYYSFIYVFLVFFETFIDFGLNNILVREAAQHPEDTPKLLGNAILLRLLLAAFSIPLAWVLVSRFDYPAPVRFGVILASFQLLLVFRSIFEVIFRLKLLMFWAAFWNGVRAVLNLLLVMAAFFLRPQIPTFILAALVSGFISMAGLAWFSLRFTRYSLKWDSAVLLRLLRECWPLAASNILTFICLRMDVMLLSKLRGFSDVGLYNAALRVTESLGIVAVSLMTSVYPLLSEAYLQDRAHFKKMIASSYRVLLLAGLPLAVGGLFTAKDLLVMLFGVSFASSGTTLAILLWYLIASFMGVFLVNVLYACRRQIVDVQITFLQMVVALFLNLILIPRFGFNGAAVATAAGGFFAVALMVSFLRRFLGIKISFWAREALTPLMINVVFFGLLFVLSHLLHWPAAGVVGGGLLIYPALLCLFGIVPPAQIRQYFEHTLAGKGQAPA